MRSSNLNDGINLKHNLDASYKGYFENYRMNNFQIRNLIKNNINEKQLSLIAGNLAQIYKAGIPITKALDLVSETLPDKIYKHSLCKVLASVNTGKSLSQGFAVFKELYPEFFIGMIAIGEETGKLYVVLKGISIFYDKLLRIKSDIKNASAYPLFVLASMIMLCIFLVNNVIPNFCEIYKDMNIKLPANCKYLYDLSLILKSDPFGTSITIICWGLIVLIISKCLWRKLNIEKFSGIPIVKSFFEYIMILLFSIISSTGINISHALNYCEDSISFNYLKTKIREINSDIIKGKTLSEAMEDSKMFSKYTIAIISLREETGTIEEGFKLLAEDLEYKFSEQINKYLKWINPIFVLIMAGFIILFLLFFVLPLFNNLQSGIR